jgi:hypothetical protein
MEAPGTAAPLWSVTVPVMEPKVVCPHAYVVRSRYRNTRERILHVMPTLLKAT